MTVLYICACAQMPAQAQALARGAPGLTSGLAEDAAEILERDYDIDAGEVLSMNIDTVETTDVQNKQEKATPEEIRKRFKLQAWSNGGVHVPIADAPHRGTITDKSSIVSDYFSIDDETINGMTRPTIRMVKDPGGHNEFIDTENYVTVTQGTEFEATYETTFGATNEFGNGSSNICGEAFYWFKLDENSENGFGICFDNHGPGGCGFFADNNNTLYFVKMVNGNITAVDYNKYKATYTNWKKFPEFGIKVTEDNGKATIEIWPNNSRAGLVDNGAGGSSEYNDANSTRIKWTNCDVALYDKAFTQAYGFWIFTGIYFADCSTTMKRTVVKSFGDIVYEPEWTDGALHMLINMDTKADSTMLGSDGGPRISHQLRPSPAKPSGSPRGWRRTRRRSWRGTTT